MGAAVTSALVADILLVAVGLSEAAAPQEVWPETEVTAHLQLPQPEAAKLADPPDSEVQQARQVRLLLQPPSTTQDHPRQVRFFISIKGVSDSKTCLDYLYHFKRNLRKIEFFDPFVLNDVLK